MLGAGLLLLVPTVALATASGELPGPHLGTAPLPLASPDRLPTRASQPHFLYVNFDGAVLRRGCGNDSRYDCSTLADMFDGYVGPFVGGESRRVAIVQAVRKDLEPFGVRTVTQRPPPDPGYTMVLYGDLGVQTFAGIAPYVDCGNLWPNDTSFAGAFQGANIGATIILQEAAHTWGLEHVNAPFDNLHPFVAANNPSFQDECHKIVANTDLVEVGGVCNLVHQLFCDAGNQNSYQELLYLFGPSVPDTSPPTVKIIHPPQDSFHVLPVTMQLTGEITDDLDPQYYTITVHRDGVELFKTTNYKLDITLKNPPVGEYVLDVTVRDQAGNSGQDRIRFTVLAEGSEDPDADGAPESASDEPDGDESSGCRVGAPQRSDFAWLLALGWLARRRRAR